MRQNTNTDTIYVGDFKGMATSGGTYAATPEYLQELTNATVTRDGTIKPRKGSVVVGSAIVASSVYTETFRFSFAGNNWVVQRYGTSFLVYIQINISGEPYTLELLSTKTNILRDASLNEPATYAVKTEGNYCHVLIATKSTQLLALVLSKRDAVVTSATTTTAVVSYGQYYTSSISIGTTKVVNGDRLSFTGSNLVGVSSSANAATFTWDTRPASVVVGSSLTFVSCFWTRFCDANYYQGAQLFNTALRRNTVPLDVNVELPELIRDSPIYNEPKLDVAANSYIAICENVAAGSPFFARNMSRTPTTAIEWDFTDGSFRPGQTANRGITHVGFGALVTGNINSRISFTRLRVVLLTDFESPASSDISTFVDKIPQTFSWFTGFPGVPLVFSASNSSVGILGVPLDSVIELVYTPTPAAGTGAVTSLVNISNDIVAHTIGDGFCVPLYGYNLIAKSKSFVFPNVVRFVGNRLVLTGNTNRILVSSADWNYRGYTFNNVQVTALDYTENSPYLLRVDQTGANISSLESVNGVMLVFNEVGSYRVTGKSRNEPPNAITANISKLSNYTANESNTVTVDNKVYFANKLGLFSVGYSNEESDGVVKELSLPVSDWFANVPTQISYSVIMDSILIRGTGQNKLLRFNITTGTWSYVHVALPYPLSVNKTYDGFTVNNGNLQLTCVWSATSATDLRDFELIGTSEVFAANTQTIATTNTLTPTLVSAHELMQTYAVSGVVVPAYGNGARAVGGASVVTEASSAKAAKPIIAHAVTKALYTDKATRGIRLRSISVYIKGVGLVRTAVTGTEATTISRHNIAVDNEGAYTVTGAKQKSHNGLPTGDTVVALLSDLGISNAYSVAFEVGQNTEIVGFALDTSAKTLGKLS